MEQQSDDKGTGARKGGYLPVGIALGTAIGAGVGVAIDNVAAGVGVGIALGVVFGIAVSEQRKNKSGDQ